VNGGIFAERGRGRLAQGGYRGHDRGHGYGRGVGFDAGLAAGSALGYGYGGYHDPYNYSDDYAYNDSGYDVLRLQWVLGYDADPGYVVSSGGDTSVRSPPLGEDRRSSQTTIKPTRLGIGLLAFPFCLQFPSRETWGSLTA
jgi:hypothetical protein